MKRQFLLGLTFAACTSLAAVGALAADPSLHEVYAAAQAGKMSEALSMMDTVLHDHPNSAKAHYVEADLLAKDGRVASARTELATAERLAPGLPFATPQAVRELDARLSPAAPHAAPVAAPAAGGMSSGLWILVIGGALAFLFFAARALVRRASVPMSAGGSTRFGGGYSMGTGSQPYGPAGMPPMAGGGAMGGMGSGILGGLATGAAVGAGIAAGEALVHHFTEGGSRTIEPSPLQNPIPDTTWDATPYDMGGNDFGITDGGSWDDAGGGGGDWS